MKEDLWQQQYRFLCSLLEKHKDTIENSTQLAKAIDREPSTINRFYSAAKEAIEKKERLASSKLSAETMHRLEKLDEALSKLKEYQNTPSRPLIARESSFPQFISEVEDKMYGYVIQYARDNHPNITAKELSEIAQALIRLAEDTYGMTRMGSPQFVIDNFERIRREMKA